MDFTDYINAFQMGSIEERARIALDPKSSAAVLQYLGKTAFAEYEKIARRVEKAGRDHLAQPVKNLIFIPGVMGSQLMSTELGGMWWIDVRTRHHIEHLRLDAQGSDSLDLRHTVVPVTTDPSYEPFRVAVLERGDFGHIVHPYDWRLSLSRTAGGLRDAILGLYENNGHRAVHLVAHSMGGLLVRTTLKEHGAVLWPKLGRIVFVGTPHFGSPAIASYLRTHFWGWEGMALLGRYLSRPALRSLRGVLQLLPAPRGVYPFTLPGSTERWTHDDSVGTYEHPCFDFDVHRANALELELSAEEGRNLQAVLDESAQLHRDLWLAHQTLDQEYRNRMAVIAGVGYKSLFRLETPQFPFSLAGPRKITQRQLDNPHRDGDGRVPLASAQLPFVGQTRFVRGEHGTLPSIPEVYNDVFRWLNGEAMQLSVTPRGALSEHLANAPLLGSQGALTSAVRTIGEDPGYLREDEYSEMALDALEPSLDAGLFPNFNRLHIL